MEHREFRDPRLAELYEVFCPWARADGFFLAVANEQPGSRLLDLGCGTGQLTLAFAAAGHTVTGLDPAVASLAIARSKPGAEAVTWLPGSSGHAPEGAFDVAFMTNHVAQFLVTDEEWTGALADLRRALVPGGRLVFDTRDPAARGWEAWNPTEFRHEGLTPDGRLVTQWAVVRRKDPGVVSVSLFYEFPDGEVLESTADMRWRDEVELRASLAAAGFTVEHLYGGWDRQAPGAGDGEFVVIASKADRSQTATEGDL